MPVRVRTKWPIGREQSERLMPNWTSTHLAGNLALGPLECSALVYFFVSLFLTLTADQITSSLTARLSELIVLQSTVHHLQ